MKHETIWLQYKGHDSDDPECDDDDCEQDEITWCQSRQFDTDVEYVRADISDELRKSRDHHASTIFIQEGRIASQAAKIANLQAEFNHLKLYCESNGLDTEDMFRD